MIVITIIFIIFLWMGNSIYFCQNDPLHDRPSNYRKPIQMTTYKQGNLTAFKQNSIVKTNPFLPCRYLGKGIFGCTVEVLERGNKQQRFAQKIVHTQHLTQDFLFLDSPLFKQLNNSLQFVHIKSMKVQGQKMYILMQKFLLGDLYSFLKRNSKQIDQSFIKELAVNIILILQKIHAKNIIYRNLRPQNILFTSRDRDRWFQLCELMFCINGEQGTSYYGAATYTPPQIYSQKQEPYDKSIDLWMLGVLLYEVMVGQTPFQGTSLAQIKQNVLNFHPEHLKFTEFQKFSQNLRDLIAKLLVPQPQNRMNFNDLHRHKFFNGQLWTQDRKPYMQIKFQKQDNLSPNRILYYNFSKSRALTRDFPEIVYQETPSREI